MEILSIMKLYAQVSISAKIISFDSDSYFWEKREVMFPWNLSLRTAKNLYPNFQKPPLLSKIPDYARDVLSN